MRGFTARNTPCMGLVDRRPVVCRNLAMGFWVPLQWQEQGLEQGHGQGLGQGKGQLQGQEQGQALG